MPPVTDGDDHVQVIELNVSGLGFVGHGPMLSGCPEFPDNHLLVQFTLTENIADVFGNGLLAFAEQSCRVVLGQPDRLIFQPDINFDFAVGSLIGKNFRIIHGGGSIHNRHS